MVLALQTISNNQQAYISLIIATTALLLIWVFSVTIIEAEATHDYRPGESTGSYCGKTCQRDRDEAEIEAREKELEDRELDNPFDEDDKKKDTNCYGIYCDKEDEDDVIKTTNLQDIIDKIQAKNFISIRVTQSCQRVDYCPSIKFLADIYDNSDKWYSGDFYQDEKTKMWKREPPQIFNVFETYKLRNGIDWMVFVEPDTYTWKNTKQITIHPHISIYKKAGEKIVDRVILQYKNMEYEPCAYANIGWMDKETNEIVGDKLLLDVLNHFMSSCKEPIEYNPTIEVFLGSTIFEDCDKICFQFKRLSQLELKAFHQTEKEFYEFYEDQEEEDKKKPGCYGIYCDRDDDDDDDEIDLPEERALTIEEKVAEAELKDQRRQQRLQELEEIQLCERIKLFDDISSVRNLDCEDDDDRHDYLAEKLQEDLKDLDPDVVECEKFRLYEITLADENKVANAKIVTCLDKYEREQYLDYVGLVYPEGIP